jgi:hypothetical protein
MFAVAGLILFAGQVRGEAIAPMRYVFNGAVSPFSNDLGYPWRRHSSAPGPNTAPSRSLKARS